MKKFILWLLVAGGALAACRLKSAPAAEEVAGHEPHEKESSFIEPILIEETMPNAPGEWALRLTTDYRRGNGDPVGTLPNLEVFYGIIDRLGTTLSIPMAYAGQDPGSHYGLGDVEARLKYLLVKPGEAAPAVALGAVTTFPTGNHTLLLGDGAYALGPFVALLKRVGPVCVQGNFGWEKQVTAGRRSLWSYGWAASIPLIQDTLHFLTEIAGDWGRPNHATLAPGLKYYLTEKFTVGAAVPIGLNKDTSEWGIITQFQIEF